MHDSTKVMSTRISMLYSVRLTDRFFYLNHIYPLSSLLHKNTEEKNTGRMKPLYKNPLLKRCCMSSHVIFTVMIKCN